jgi:hypothetical protein
MKHISRVIWELAGLNRLELVIFVEDWTGLELHDDDVEKINVVGDLIRLFESAKEQRDRLN